MRVLGPDAQDVARRGGPCGNDVGEALVAFREGVNPSPTIEGPSPFRRGRFDA